jgi:hypothetical protein
MNSKKTFLTLGIAAALALGTAIIFASPSYSQQPGGITGQSNVAQPGLYSRGTIASVQNDKDGKPAWIVSGLWRGSLTNMSSAAMMSSSGANTTTKNLPTATFASVFDMLMLNGSALHKHEISNVTLKSISLPNEKTAIYNGTATITMKEGPVNDVPISIRTLNDNAISIWIDPAKTMNHFGNTPIYGTITQEVLVRK